MIFIRRAMDKHRAYTVIMLKGEAPKWIPTSDYEHQRILEIFLQDKYYEGIENDFSENADDMKKAISKIRSEFLKSTLDKEKNYPNIARKNNDNKK